MGNNVCVAFGSHWALYQVTLKNYIPKWVKYIKGITYSVTLILHCHTFSVAYANTKVKLKVLKYTWT